MLKIPQLLKSKKITSLPDKVVVAVSDTELAGGDICDAFTADDMLTTLIDSYTKGKYADLPVDFIFNGDNFDFIKVKVDGTFPRHIDAKTAVKKVAIVYKAHKKVFDALTRFVSHPSGNKNLFFLTGNHDPEMVFPEVQARLKKLIGTAKSVHFPGFHYIQDGVMATHGQQYDETFHVDPKKLFIDYNGMKILNLPFMTYAIIDTMCPMKEILPDYEQITPHDKLFKYYPLARKLVMKTAAKYTAKAIFVNPLTQRKDATLRLPREVKKQYIRRLISGDTEVKVDDSVVKDMKKKGAKAVIIGHLHDFSKRDISGLTILKVGTFRDEYGMRKKDDFFAQPKSWAEVLVRNKKPVQSKVFTMVNPDQAPHEVFTYGLLESGTIK